MYGSLGAGLVHAMGFQDFQIGFPQNLKKRARIWLWLTNLYCRIVVQLSTPEKL